MSELILELFSEEIPAFMQKGAEVAYTQIFTKALAANEISFEGVKVFSGPRRITVYVTGLPKFIEAKEVEIKGPKVSAPAQSLEGFCKSNEININSLTQKEIHGQLFYVYLKPVLQTDLKVLLLEIMPIAIKEHTWPKSMYWGDYNISWVRPLKNIMCLFDGETLPVQFGHLTANNITYGHRFMAPAEITVNSFEDYKDKLQKAFVIIDREERERIIKEQLEKIASEHKLVIKEDLRLLEEVTGLVEWPVVMIGTIPEKFLKVPPEALISSMRTHQKYFSTYDKLGNFAPYFLFASNLVSSDPQVIIHGNEKVLSARLSDALYFYEQDLKKGLEVMGEKLENIIFHKKLDTVGYKVERIERFCEFLGEGDQDLLIADLITAANLCKNDLVSEMVGEFPELQGIMGYYYALNNGFSKEIAIAIRDHYKPLGPTDIVPKGLGAYLALADKLDSLVGLMLVGETSTGSGDSYALRRIALGIIRIILDNKISLNLKSAINHASLGFACLFLTNDLLKSVDINTEVTEASEEKLEEHVKKFITERNQPLVSFIEERAKFYFKNKYDIALINAVLDLEREGDLLITKLKLDALKDFLSKKVGGELLVSYKRVSNILSDKLLEGRINSKFLMQREEIVLSHLLELISVDVNFFVQKRNFLKVLKAFAKLNLPIKDFFDNVMVNDPDPKLANNRLLLLLEVKQLFEKIAKFDQL